MNSPAQGPTPQERLDAWYDGAAICIIAVGAHGEPLDLSEHEVEAFIQRLQACLSESRGEAHGKEGGLNE